VLERRRKTQGSTEEKVTLNGEPRTPEPLRPRVKSKSDSFDFATQTSKKSNLLYFRRQADMDGLLSSEK